MKDDAAASRGEAEVSRARSGEKYERLLGGAAALMARQGYSQTTMRDVARETGFSLAGMYYYFKSKEDLLFQIQQRTFSELLALQEEQLARGGDAAERLRRLIDRHLAFYVRHADELKVCTYELDSLSGEKYQQIESLRRRYFALGVAIIAEVMGVRPGSVHEAAPVRHATLFLFGMLNWVFMWYRPGRDCGPEQLAREMADFVLDGLRGSRS